MQGQHRRAAYALAAILLLLGPAAGPAQEQGGDAGATSLEASALRVFLDCRCDTEYIRREIPFVSYVNLRQDAQVHLLVTDQASGAGGRQYQLNFIGGRDRVGRVDTLVYDSPATDTEELRRRGLVRVMKVGLLPYITGTPQAAGIDINYTAPRASAASGSTQARTDPWNYWNFRASVNGNLNDQSTRASYSVNGSFSANRTTDSWKTSLSVSGRKNYSEIELSDRTVTDENHNWQVDGLMVRSITPHLSIGGRAQVLSSVFSNYDLMLSFAPAVEYNLFPYAESSRRSFVFRYTAGVTWSDYDQETLYFKTTETLANQSVQLSYSLQQPWGAARISTEYSSYLHDLGFNAIQLNGDFGINITRGLSLDLGGSFERVRDQVSLARGELSDDEVLLNRRQQSTGHRLRLQMGMSYRFGSIYNNVVNTRFNENYGGPGGGGGGGGGGGRY